MDYIFQWGFGHRSFENCTAYTKIRKDLKRDIDEKKHTTYLKTGTDIKKTVKKHLEVEILDSDRLLGGLIIVGVIVAAILYFGSVVSPWWSLLGALKVVVSAAFLVVLGIGGWIGWTMASTPSPEPVEDLDEDIEDLDIEEDLEEPVDEDEEDEEE